MITRWRRRVLGAVLVSGFAAAGAADQLDTQHLRLELTFTDTARYTGRVVQTIRLRDAAETVELDAVGLDIRSVRGDGERTLAFEKTPRTLRVQLASGGAAAGALVTLSIDYTGVAGRGVYAGGPSRERPRLPRQVWSNSWPEDARYFIPCHDALSDKTTAELLLTIPKSWEATSNGALLGVTSARAARTWHWRLTQPVATYLLSFVAGEYETVRANPAPASVAGASTTLDYLVYRGRADDARQSFASTGEILRFFEEQTGLAYPYPKLSQAVVADFLFGAMENVSAITYGEDTLRDAAARLDKSGIDTIAHEIAHQWWGDTVTPARWDEVWLSEGFATYYSDLFRERSEGADAASYARLQNADKYFALPVEVRSRPMLFGSDDPNELLSPLTYERGALVLGMLRHTIGEAAFQNGIANYLGRFAFKSATTADLQASMEQAARHDLSWFFTQWVLEAGYPELRFSWRWDEPSRRIVLRLEQVEDKGGPSALFQLALDVRIATASTSHQERIFLERQQQEFSLPADGVPRSVLVDPGAVHLKQLHADKPLEERLFDLTAGPMAADRVLAARDLARLGGERVIASLGTALAKDPFWGARVEAAKGLGVIGGPAVVASLRLGATDKDPRVREAAFAAMTSAPSGAVASDLRAALRADPSELAQAAALRALGTLRAEGAWEALSQALLRESHADRIRIAGLEGLGLLGDRRAVPVALEMTGSGRSPTTRGAAIKTLETLGRGQAVVVSRLERLLADPQPAVRKAAAAALGQLGSSAGVLRTVAANDDVPAVRREAVKALARIERP